MESLSSPADRVRKINNLSSALHEKDTGEVNIVTAEDPIEYDLGGQFNGFRLYEPKAKLFQIYCVHSTSGSRCDLNW